MQKKKQKNITYNEETNPWIQANSALTQMLGLVNSIKGIKGQTG